MKFSYCLTAYLFSLVMYCVGNVLWNIGSFRTTTTAVTSSSQRQAWSMAYLDYKSFKDCQHNLKWIFKKVGYYKSDT